MTIDIIHQHSNTLPSGFKINFTVGRIVKDIPHSLPKAPPSAAKPHGEPSSAPCGTNSAGEP